MNWIRTLACGMMFLAAFAGTGGCSKKDSPAKTDPKSDTSDKGAKDTKGKGKDDHGAHGAGPHGGAVADWGGGKYHVEFTVDHDKKEATVYILGSDEKTAAPIKAKDDELLLSIKGLKNKDEYKVVLKADPQAGDPKGKSSRFVGKDEKLGTVQEFAGTISGEADGAPYAGDFKEEPPEKK